MSAIDLISGPAVEPVSLADAKSHLRVDHAVDDDLIQAYITAAREQAEEYTQRTLIQSVWEVSFSGFAAALPLRKPPVISVESVKYLDVTGTEQELTAEDWRLIKSRKPALLVPAFGKCFPGTCRDAEAVRIRYTAGYGATPADVPGPIKQWILLQVGNMYENRSTEVLGSTSSLSNSFFMGLLDTYCIIEV